MLKFAKQQLCSLFPSYFVTQADSFASIINPSLCSNPGAFLTLYYIGISGAPSHSAAMNRFSVKSITHNKVAGAPGHKYLEYLSVKVQDVEGWASLVFFIERSVSISLSQPPPDGINTTNGANRKTATAPSLSSAEAPVNVTSEFSLPLSPSLQHPLLESASVTSQLAHDTARSQESEAVDLIFGTAYARKTRYRSEEVVREIKPDGLSLFELALLVDMVHKVAPIYPLFENQCFWFAQTICDVVELSEANCARSYLPFFLRHDI